MIYEDFNRPIIVRWIEYFRFWITRKPHTLGIMQVTTDKFIDNEESIKQAMQVIHNLGADFIKEYSDSKYGEYYTSVSSSASYIAQKYNGGGWKYQEEVWGIFTTIESYYSNIKSLIPDKADIDDTKK
jgi:hypothetical protein